MIDEIVPPEVYRTMRFPDALVAPGADWGITVGDPADAEVLRDPAWGRCTTSCAARTSSDVRMVSQVVMKRGRGGARGADHELGLGARLRADAGPTCRSRARSPEHRSQARAVSPINSGAGLA
jgi:hypothetical protein